MPKGLLPTQQRLHSGSKWVKSAENKFTHVVSWIFKSKFCKFVWFPFLSLLALHIQKFLNCYIFQIFWILFLAGFCHLAQPCSAQEEALGCFTAWAPNSSRNSRGLSFLPTIKVPSSSLRKLLRVKYTKEARLTLLLYSAQASVSC